MTELETTETIETPAVTGEISNSNSDQVYNNSVGQKSSVPDDVGQNCDNQLQQPRPFLPDNEPLSENISTDTKGSVTSKPVEPDLTEKAMLLEAASSAILWHDLEGEAYSTIVLGDKRSNVKLRSREFKNWLSCKAYALYRCAPSGQAVDAVLRMLEGKAKFEGEELDPQVRVSGDASTTYLHLGDESGSIIRIDAAGASDASDASIKFLSKPGMRPLPNPVIPQSVEEAKAILDDLRKFCNLKDDGDWLLYLVSLLSALRPIGPFVVVVVVGEQGSAKSTVCKVFRRLIDPSKAPLRSAPREERDLWVAASNGWIVAFDNVSRISQDLSDAICRLATGGGNSYRTIYENDSETLFQSQRLVLLNTIDDLTLRGDLVDRAIQLTCYRIDDKQRRTEIEFWTEFDNRAGAFLGALLWVLSKTLKELPSVKLEQSPRMADFARFGTAVEQALQLPQDTFIHAYQANRKALASVALENQFTELLMNFDLPFEGTASKLWENLLGLTSATVDKLPRWFPANGQVLSSKLRRLAPFFRQRGIEIEFTRSSERIIRLSRIENLVPE